MYARNGIGGVFFGCNKELEVLDISLLGVLEITVDEESIEVDSNYVRALLCFLVLEKHRPHRREALAELLWPEKPEGVARNSLKQALSNLRKALGDRENPSPYLLVTRDEIQFNQCSDFRIDALAFTDEIAAYEDHPHDDLATCKVCKSHLKRAVELYGGDFLSDFYLPENQEFCNWIILKQEVFQRQVAEAFSKLALIYKDQGEVAQAIEYSRQLAELEPWNEENHRNLMRLLAQNGVRSAALRQYQTCCECLDQELGVQPSIATVNLYEEIKAWESGTFVKTDQIKKTLGHRAQAVNLREITHSSRPSQNLFRRIFAILIVFGLILGFGSVYWIGDRIFHRQPLRLMIRLLLKCPLTFQSKQSSLRRMRPRPTKSKLL